MEATMKIELDKKQAYTGYNGMLNTFRAMLGYDGHDRVDTESLASYECALSRYERKLIRVFGPLDSTLIDKNHRNRS